VPRSDCSTASIASSPPVVDVASCGVLDLADADAFITGFLAAAPAADLVPPFGVLDLADIDTFITTFTNGCNQPYGEPAGNLVP